MLELRFRFAFQFGDDSLSENLAEFDAPLVERIDVPDRTLRENAMLIQRDESAERFRREPFGKDGVRRAVAFEDPMGHQPIRRTFGFDLLWCLTEGQRLPLREDVRQQ